MEAVGWVSLHSTQPTTPSTGSVGVIFKTPLMIKMANIMIKAQNRIFEEK